MDITNLKPTDYLKIVQNIFKENGHPEVALGQMKYMRHKFEFYGMKAPVWLGLTKDIFKTNGLFEKEDLKTFVRLCFEQEYREVHYLALEMVQKQLKKQDIDFIDFLEELIITQSWWDSVDWIFKFVGIHILRFPQLKAPVAWRWVKTDNIWLIRSAICFQLKYKEKTDTDLLFQLILQHADSTEFFIQKGCGWILREYSKTDGPLVVDFIEKNNLPSLTKREGLKWLRNIN